MIKPGTTLVLPAKSDALSEYEVCSVEVIENLGPIPGYGWLLRSRENRGSLVLCKLADGFITDVLFIVRQSDKIALLWLVGHPERMNDLEGFKLFLKQSQALKKYWQQAPFTKLEYD